MWRFICLCRAPGQNTIIGAQAACHRTPELSAPMTHNHAAD